MTNSILDVLNFADDNNGKLHIMRTLPGWAGGKINWHVSLTVSNDGTELKIEADALTYEEACTLAMSKLNKVWTKPLRTALTSNLLEAPAPANDGMPF